MKLKNNLMVAVALLGLLLVAIPAMASDAKYAKETQAYKDGLDVWTKGVKIARETALNTYENVQVVVDKMYWKPSRNYKNVKDLYLDLRIVNGSGVYVEIPSISFEYRDSQKRKVNFDIWQEDRKSVV